MRDLGRWRRRIAQFFGLGAGDDRHVSAACLADIRRYEATRGVDLPTWRTPREVETLRTVNGDTPER